MSSNTPCSACKFQRRKCTPECIFAPYFPPEDPQKFVNVHKVFGGSNVSKILSDLNPAQRAEAARSLAYEAEYRLRDPIYGCVGYIDQLQQRLKQIHFNLRNAKEELATYMGPSALQPTFPQHAAAYDNNSQMLCNNNVVFQQQQMMGNPSSALPYTNLIGAPTAVVYDAGASQPQQPQMMVGGGNFNLDSSNFASALPYTSLMPSGGFDVVGPSSQAMLIREQQEQLQHEVMNPAIIQQYGGAVAAATADQGQHHQLLRSYGQQQGYLVFKSSGDQAAQYELQAAAPGSFIQKSAAAAAAAAEHDEIGAAGPSLALGVNYDQDPYNSQNHDQQRQHAGYAEQQRQHAGYAEQQRQHAGYAEQQQQHAEYAEQHHIDFQAQLLVQQHPDNHVLQTHQRKAESDGKYRSADPGA